MSATPFLIAATFCGAASLSGAVFFVVYRFLFRYEDSIRRRVHELDSRSTASTHSHLLDLKQLARQAEERSEWTTWLRSLIDQAGLRQELSNLVGFSLGLLLAFAGAAYMVTRIAWIAPLAGAIGFSIPWLYVWKARQDRHHKMTTQLPAALDVISRAVSAGQTVLSTFQIIADDFPAPLGDEFRNCYEQQNLGIAYDAALRGLARRTGIMELRILAVALIVQAKSGGSLQDVLTKLASMVRKRLALRQRVRALTGEGRMQAAVLMALPCVVFAAMYVLNREYATVLLERPCLLVGCVVSQGVGSLLICKLIQIEP